MQFNSSILLTNFSIALKEHDAYCITIKNDADAYGIYVALNGMNYTVIQPQQEATFKIIEDEIQLSIIESQEKKIARPRPSINDLRYQPHYHVSFVLDPEAPAAFTLAYSTVKALQKLSIIRNSIATN